MGDVPEEKIGTPAGVSETEIQHPSGCVPEQNSAPQQGGARTKNLQVMGGVRENKNRQAMGGAEKKISTPRWVPEEKKNAARHGGGPTLPHRHHPAHIIPGIIRPRGIHFYIFVCSAQETLHLGQTLSQGRRGLIARIL